MTDNEDTSLASTGCGETPQTESPSPEVKTNKSAADGDQSMDLRVRLELLKRRYEDELSSFSEYKIEHVLKNSGAKEYLERVREKERANNEIIASLREELELKRKEAELWKSKCQVAEQQCCTYLRNWKDAQVRNNQLEAERAALEEEKERQLVISKSMNFSCASSLADQSVPPPPPITMEEIMKQANNSTSHLHLMNASSASQMFPNISSNSNSNNNQSMGSNMSGHHYSSSSMSLLYGLHRDNNSTSSMALPPPTVEFSGANLVPQFYQQTTAARSNSSTNESGSNGGHTRFSKNGTTGVGGRYGRVFNSRSGGLA